MKLKDTGALGNMLISYFQDSVNPKHLEEMERMIGEIDLNELIDEEKVIQIAKDIHGKYVKNVDNIYIGSNMDIFIALSFMLLFGHCLADAVLQPSSMSTGKSGIKYLRDKPDESYSPQDSVRADVLESNIKALAKAIKNSNEIWKTKNKLD